MGSIHVGDSLATHNCVDFVESHESRTQVYMSTDGELAVHDNVVFEANTALFGGAVSCSLNSIGHPSVDVCFDRFCES
jgi:predicted outer membrane repeat protein